MRSSEKWTILAGHLADRMEDCSTGESVVVWVRKPNIGSFCCSQPFVHQVWLCCGPPECLTFSYCAWLWSGLLRTSKRHIVHLLYINLTFKASCDSWITRREPSYPVLTFINRIHKVWLFINRQLERLLVTINLSFPLLHWQLTCVSTGVC